MCQMDSLRRSTRYLQRSPCKIMMSPTAMTSVHAFKSGTSISIPCEKEEDLSPRTHFGRSNCGKVERIIAIFSVALYYYLIYT